MELLRAQSIRKFKYHALGAPETESTNSKTPEYYISTHHQPKA